MSDTPQQQRPQDQTEETEGRIARPQRDEHTPGRKDVARGSEPATAGASRRRG